LRVLDLPDNQLTSLPECIGNLDSLRVLNVEENQLTSLPDEICNLAYLDSLNVGSNQLAALPDSIGTLRRLRWLRAYNNSIQALPNSFANLIELRWLYLQSNSIEALPDGMGNLSNLNELYISTNLLTNLPESIIQLNNIKMNVADNKLCNLSIELEAWLDSNAPYGWRERQNCSNYEIGRFAPGNELLLRVSVNKNITRSELPSYGHVKVTVYSANGKMMNAPVNEYQGAGYHYLFLKESGVVFINIQFGRQSVTKKLTLIN
jgi:Leucine-rich repeat (LRR) protein